MFICSSFHHFVSNYIHCISLRTLKNLCGSTKTCESRTDQKFVDIEIERIRSTFQNTEQEKSAKRSFEWLDFLRNPGRKTLTIGIILTALNHITGSYALLNYQMMVSPNESALVVGILLCHCWLMGLGERHVKLNIIKSSPSQTLDFTVTLLFYRNKV